MTRDLTDLRTHPGQPSCRGVRITLNWSWTIEEDTCWQQTDRSVR